MARRFSGKKKKSGEDMALQITSMADIFTIILVFLLKSFASDSGGISPTQSLTLPKARGGGTAAEMLKVEVSANTVALDGRAIANLQNYQFTPADLQGAGISQGVEHAFQEARAKAQVRAAGGAPGTNPTGGNDPRLTIFADHKVPYTTLKRVLASAANSGYTEYKLVVVKAEDQ